MDCHGKAQHSKCEEALTRPAAPSPQPPPDAAAWHCTRLPAAAAQGCSYSAQNACSFRFGRSREEEGRQGSQEKGGGGSGTARPAAGQRHAQRCGWGIGLSLGYQETCKGVSKGVGVLHAGQGGAPHFFFLPPLPWGAGAGAASAAFCTPSAFAIMTNDTPPAMLFTPADDRGEEAEGGGGQQRLQHHVQAVERLVPQVGRQAHVQRPARSVAQHRGRRVLREGGGGETGQAGQALRLLAWAATRSSWAAGPAAMPITPAPHPLTGGAKEGSIFLRSSSRPLEVAVPTSPAHMPVGVWGGGRERTRWRQPAPISFPPPLPPTPMLPATHRRRQTRRPCTQS